MYKTVTEAELKKILENHKHWLNKDCTGWQCMRANLLHAYIGYMDLSGIEFRSIDFEGAIFSNVNLSGVIFDGCCLDRANFLDTNLAKTRFTSTTFNHAEFSNVDLSEAAFPSANFYMTRFSSCVARKTNFENCVFSFTEFTQTDITDAKLKDVELRYTKFPFDKIDRTENAPYLPSICPDAGSFTGWKKAGTDGVDVLVCLEIPADAKRLSGAGRKCRCDKAKVLGIYNLDGTPSERTEAYSGYDSDFVYRVGETVSVPNFNENRFNECAEGIHFFITRQEAIDYIF